MMDGRGFVELVCSSIGLNFTLVFSVLLDLFLLILCFIGKTDSVCGLNWVFFVLTRVFDVPDYLIVIRVIEEDRKV